MRGWKLAWSSRPSWCWRWWQLCKPTLFYRPSPQTHPQVTASDQRKLTIFDELHHYGVVWRWRLLLLWVPVSQASNGTDDSLLRALHGGGSPPGSSLLLQPSSIPMLSACFNKLFSMLQVHHVQVNRSYTRWCYTLWHQSQQVFYWVRAEGWIESLRLSLSPSLSVGVIAAALADTQSQHLHWRQWRKWLRHLSVQRQPRAHHPSEPRSAHRLHFIVSFCFSAAPFKLQDYHRVLFWLIFERAFIDLSTFSIHQQFPDSVGLVPQHLPEDLVSGVALSCLDDQHAAYWSVSATDICVDLKQ